MKIWIATVYPATGALPKLRANPNQRRPACGGNQKLQNAGKRDPKQLPQNLAVNADLMRITCGCGFSRRTASTTGKRHPSPRPVVVATEAPITFSCGNGPQPLIRHGSSTMLMMFANHSARIASAGSPAPRKIALIRKSRKIVTDPPSRIPVYVEPMAITAGVAPMIPSRCGAKKMPVTPTTPDSSKSDGDRLYGRDRRAFGIFLADPPRHERRGRHAEPHRDAEHQYQARFGQRHGRQRIHAEACDEENIDDAEERFHQHLEHHGDRQQDDRAAEIALRQVAMSAGQGFPDGREKASIYGGRGLDGFLHIGLKQRGRYAVRVFLF